MCRLCKSANRRLFLVMHKWIARDYWLLLLASATSPRATWKGLYSNQHIPTLVMECSWIYARLLRKVDAKPRLLRRVSNWSCIPSDGEVTAKSTVDLEFPECCVKSPDKVRFIVQVWQPGGSTTEVRWSIVRGRPSAFIGARYIKIYKIYYWIRYQNHHDITIPPVLEEARWKSIRTGRDPGVFLMSSAHMQNSNCENIGSFGLVFRALCAFEFEHRPSRTRGKEKHDSRGVNDHRTTIYP